MNVLSFLNRPSENSTPSYGSHNAPTKIFSIFRGEDISVSGSRIEGIVKQSWNLYLDEDYAGSRSLIDVAWAIIGPNAGRKQVLESIFPDIMGKLYYCIGKNFDAIEYDEDAKEAFMDAVRVDQYNPLYYYDLGITLIKVDERDQAELVLEEMQEVFPTFYLTFTLQGYVSLSQNNPKEAAVAFSDAIKRNQDSLTAYDGLETAYLVLREPAKARKIRMKKKTLESGLLANSRREE